MSSIYALHHQLAADTTLVKDLELCSCLLMEDARYAWLILVPRVADLRELHEVPRALRETLFNEIETTSKALQKITDAHKLNVAALGNQVPQLHVHIIARQTDDAAWPGPVWGVGSAEVYTEDARATRLNGLRQALER
jgi:diadenosine tetraphosphate (Ap4A) HIT family hydrolase